MSYYSKQEECANNLFIKYGFPKLINSEDADGKIFDSMIEGENNIYILFKDNTFASIHIRSSGEFVYTEFDKKPYYAEFIEDLKSIYPEAAKEYKEFESSLYKQEEQERKLKQYQTLKQEFED